MKNLLILGNSNIVRRRVLPAALSFKNFEKIDLATSRSTVDITIPTDRQGVIFSDYAKALKESQSEVVYISLTNQAHGEWARKALHEGRHVIVDKPAFIDLATAEELVNFADKKNCLLAEATVYAYHPQIRTLQRLFSERKASCQKMLAQFSVPPFGDDNFRYRSDLGGGALLDMGPYAVSASRIFFQETPLDVQCRVLTTRSGVDTGFSVMLTYSEGRSFIGQFGFDTEYSNYARLLGSNLSVWLDRIFTTHPNQTQTLHYRGNNEDGQLSEPAADSFAEFFRVILNANSNEINKFKQDLLQDARLLDKMRKNAKKENP